MVLCRACVRCQAAHKRCDTLPGHIVCQRCLGRKGKPVQCVWKPSRQGQRNDLLSHGRETFVKARFEQSPASNDVLPFSAIKPHSNGLTGSIQTRRSEFLLPGKKAFVKARFEQSLSHYFSSDSFTLSDSSDSPQPKMMFFRFFLFLAVHADTVPRLTNFRV